MKILRDIMTSEVSSLNSDASIREAAEKMKNLNVGSIPVCDNSNRPIGIVTDRDIVLGSVSKGQDSLEPVESVMTRNVITASPDTDVHEAARIMAKHQIRRLPVVDSDKLVGIVSIGDLAIRDIYENEAGSALSSISEDVLK
ncbi:CBS domain-containing protein [Clostridiaceae bacterium M8S5]|nr:CBS domain-containing protein [Clostridiaceae bacterium M8S5]